MPTTNPTASNSTPNIMTELEFYRDPARLRSSVRPKPSAGLFSFCVTCSTKIPGSTDRKLCRTCKRTPFIVDKDKNKNKDKDKDKLDSTDTSNDNPSSGEDKNNNSEPNDQLTIVSLVIHNQINDYQEFERAMKELDSKYSFSISSFSLEVSLEERINDEFERWGIPKDGE